MKRRIKRILAVVLALAMIITSTGVSRYATVIAEEPAVSQESKTASEKKEEEAEKTEEKKEEKKEDKKAEQADADKDDKKSDQAEPAAQEKKEAKSEDNKADKEETSEEAKSEDDKQSSEEKATDNTEESDKDSDRSDDQKEQSSEESKDEKAPEATTDEKAPETTTAAPEATTAEEATTEETFKKGKLSYDGYGYRITVSYGPEAEIPEGASLSVKEISTSSGKFEGYKDKAAAAAGFSDEKEEKVKARFFDIKIKADGKEIEPEKTVKVKISFNKPLDDSERGELKAVHFGKKGTETVEMDSVGTSGKSGEVNSVSFAADSFSVYGVVYTVDFTYDGFTYSIAGESSIKLSELAEILKIAGKGKDYTSGKVFVSEVDDVSFTDESLVKVSRADGDWILKSLKPFSSTETLTITMKNGDKYVIRVDDVAENTELSNFLTNVVITGATQNPDGRYEVEQGKEYSLIATFAENSTYQFANGETLTYDMPEGIAILTEQNGPLAVNIVYKGRTYQVDATYHLGTNGHLEIKFDESDPDFPRLEESTNVSFRFSYDAAFDGSETEIKFNDEIERDIVFDEPKPGQAFANKTAEYDEATGKFTYTIKVTADGDVTNVNVKDVISGNALIFNNDVRVTGNSSSYRDNGASNGFDYTFASMREGEEITITYSASVDFSKDSDKDGKITADQTKNTVTVKPEGGDPHNSEYSREITFKTTDKSNGTDAGTTEDGDKIIEWTIDYNPLALAPVAGDRIKDTISAASAEYMKYYGDGLTIEVYDHSGRLVETRNVNYDQLTSHSDSSWTYTIPDSDTVPYHYVITYQTVVDMDKVNGGGVPVTLDNDANGDPGSASVTPKNKIGVNKEVETFSTEEVSWVSTLAIPDGGLTQAVVTDTLPAIWLNGANHYDAYKDGTLDISGLLPGESYSVETTQSAIKITFFKDSGKSQTGLQATPGGHTITVRLTTKVDQEWLEKGYETGGYEQNHTNTIDLNGEKDTATVTFGKPGIEKKGEASKDSQGKVSLKYTVLLSGVSDVPVSVKDTFDTNLLEIDSSKIGSWDHMRIWGGSQWSQDAGRDPVSYSETNDGIILTANSVPLQPDGHYYPYYKIIYYLTLKDGVDLDQLAIANGGEYDLVNTAKWGDHESSYIYKTEYDSLDKELMNAGELGGTDRTAKYKITFNKAKATLNKGEPMTMTDTLSSNLSVDYSSISIETDPAGQSVPYSLSGGDAGTTVATYTIPDSTKVVITYDAEVRGNGSQTIVNKVSVNGKEEKVENTKSYGSASEGSGAVASFKIVKVDGYDANKKLEGVQFKIFCENPDLDFGTGGNHAKEIFLTTDENGEIYLDGAAYDFYFDETYHVQEVAAPEDYGAISFDYLVTLTNDMSKVDYGHYIYYYSDSMQIKNWPLEGLVVEKKVESEDQADKDKYYKFRVSILNDDGTVNTDYNEKNGDDQFENGVVEFELKDKEQKMFWGFAKGTRYKVEEIDDGGLATTVEYDVFDEDGNVTEHKTESGKSHTGQLTQADETVVFTNSKDSPKGSLKIKKNVTVNGKATTGTEADGTYTFEVKDADGTVKATETITITNGESNEIQIDNLEPGTYTVSEDVSQNPDGMALIGDNDVEVEVEAGEEAEIKTAEFTNNKTEVGSLKIKKNVTVNGKATTGTKADGTYTFEVKDAEGTVKATETITITNGASNEVQVDNLEPGTYTVSEDVTKNPEGMALVGENGVEIEVQAGEEAEIKTAEFTNNKTEVGSLKIKKNVTVNGKATTGTKADGTYTFEVKDAEGTVKATETITITNGASNEVQVDNLEPGTYTVSEDVTKNPDGMALVGENDIEVEVEAGEEAEIKTAEFTNNKTEVGSLKIKKNVTVNGKATTGTEADGTYTFEVKDADGTVKATETIKITNGESNEIQIDNLEPGTYTVSEDVSQNPDGMALIGDNDVEVEVEAGEEAEIKTAEFTNNKPDTPTFEKKIQDINDTTGEKSPWQDSADYDIGDEIPYKLTATLASDVSSYKKYSIKFEDQMEKSLTFKEVSKVVLGDEDITDSCTITPDGQKFTVSKTWEGDSISEGLNGATVEVYFTATLNENAKIGSEGNVNAARLHFSNNPSSSDDSTPGKTPWDYVIAFTYKLNVNKVDQAGEALEGAEFKLEKKLADGTMQTIELTVEGNVFSSKGLDDGEYVLTETKAPKGYEPINPIEFTVNAEHGVTWDYTSDELNFNGEGRAAILESLTGENESGDLIFADEQSLESLEGTVENKELGSLKLKKIVTVKGEPTTGTQADGDYTFTIKGIGENSSVSKTVIITIENGVIKSAKIDDEDATVDDNGYVEVTDLVSGDYTITETPPKNGTSLINAEGGKDVADDKVVTVTVVAGETADAVKDTGKAAFTNDKPDTPSFEKKIQDTNDSTGETSDWQDSADYDIGDEIPFKLTATLASDVSNYKSYSIQFDDQMEPSLTFKGISKVILTKNNGSKQDITRDSVFNPATGGQKFNVNTGWGKNYNEERMPINESLNGATVDVYFTAVLNSSANIGSEGNVNAARLRYSNNPNYADSYDYTPWDYVIAFTYKLDVNKVDQAGEALEGAEFKLEKKLADGTMQTIELTVDGNVFSSKGLDDGEYVLTETKAPKGYVPIDPISFTVSAEHVVTWDYTSDNLNFNGKDRTAILKSLMGETESGDLTFDDKQSLEGLEGTVKNIEIVKAHFEATKEFNDWGKADSFTFNLEAVSADAPMPEKTSAEATKDDPTAVFGSIEYDKAGTYEYTITEVNDGVEGVTYDTTAHKAIVTVTEDSETKELKATVKYDGDNDELIITNSFSAVKVILKATKQFSDWSKADHFDFILKPIEGAPLPETGRVDERLKEAYATATEASVDAMFGEITFDKTGTFKYTITEEDGGVDGVTYDTTPHEVVVTVTKEEDTNRLVPEVKYDDADSLIITNTYEGATATLQATKEFNDWGKADSFTFKLAALTDGAPMPTKTSAEATKDDPTAVFGSIEYEKSGTYEYTITEVNDGADGVTYDTTAHKAVVTVTKGSGNKLTTSVKYDDKDSLIITNEFKGVKVPIEATKEFNDWGKASSFTFDLAAVTEKAPMPAGTSATATEAEPKASFGEIEFDKAGTYEYTITERNDGIDGVSYDTTSHKVIVTVTKDEKTNELSASVKYDDKDSLTITNTFTPIKAPIEVTKKFNDWGKADSFTFNLEAVSKDAPMPASDSATATKNAVLASFGEIEYEKAGVYEYTITEVNDGVDGVSYDTTPHAVVVTVLKAEDATNALTAEVKYDDEDSLTVTNTFTSTKAPIEVTKEFNDWGKADSFTFNLAALTEGAPMPEKTTAEATKDAPLASFGEIEYVKTGTYEYTITEDNDGADGVSYDVTPHKVVVKVTKAEDETNKLKATVTYEGKDSLTITNKFTPVKAPVQVTKQFNDWGKADSFTFTLKAVTEGAPMPEDTTAKATKDAVDAKFGEIEYEKTGIYEYTITETDDGLDGVEYDTTPHKVVVTVSKAEDATNALTAEVKYDGKDALVVTNTYESAKATLQTTKSFNDWGKAESFTFTLKGVDGAPMPEKKTAKATKDAPTAVFGEIEFEKSGTYEYTITETNDGADGVSYDVSEHSAVVTVTKGEKNKLIATVTYDDEDSLIVTNTYTPAKASIETTKAFKDWGKADSFTFELAAVTANAPMPAKTTAIATKAEPAASFGEIEFKKAGTYEYTITEKNEGADGVSYDTTPHKVVVAVTKAEDATNKLTAKVTYEGKDSLTVTNTFTPVKTNLKATKKINSWGKATYFVFNLKAVTEGAPMPAMSKATATKAAPTAVFGDITFEKTGTYKYTITEQDEGVDGITYDTSAHEVTVTVTKADDATNKLQATVTYDGKTSLTITNSYDAKGSIKFAGKKTLKGKDLKAGEFTFEVTDEDGNVIQTVSNKADGTIKFEEINYDLDDVGTHTYTVSEVDPDDEDIECLTDDYTVTVKVKDNGDGTLKVTASSNYKKLNFVNKYEKDKKEKKKSKSSKTGDNTPLALYGGLGLLALLIAALEFIRRRRDRQNAE